MTTLSFAQQRCMHDIALYKFLISKSIYICSVHIKLFYRIVLHHSVFSFPQSKLNTYTSAVHFVLWQILDSIRHENCWLFADKHIHNVLHARLEVIGPTTVLIPHTPLSVCQSACMLTTHPSDCRAHRMSSCGTCRMVCS